MGITCCNVFGSNDSKEAVYNHTVQLKIRDKDYFGKVYGTSSITCKLSNPINIHSQKIKVGRERVWATTGVLPGVDPKGQIPKECQDNCFMLETSFGSLAALFDGHGANGKLVVEFAEKHVAQYYKSNGEQFYNTPLEAIQECLVSLDTKLKSKDSEIDCYASGTTAILLYLSENGHFVGSVGDSRALLATLKDEPMGVKTSLGDGSDIRPIPLDIVQITTDQKPNDPEERDRILKSGGRVSRMTDTLGNQVGPFRVWKGSHNYPGLAMSRSLGDSCASDIGIIPTPISIQIDTNTTNDQFYVLASDGIWDTMTNEDVAMFVDRHRGVCKRKSTYRADSIASSENCNIAHLLCEEGRMRWLKIVEDEDVLIDDISCIVIELTVAPKSERQIEMMDSIYSNESTLSHEVEADSKIIESAIYVPSRMDPGRSSIYSDHESKD